MSPIKVYFKKCIDFIVMNYSEDCLSPKTFNAKNLNTARNQSNLPYAIVNSKFNHYNAEKSLATVSHHFACVTRKTTTFVTLNHNAKTLPAKKKNIGHHHLK